MKGDGVHTLADAVIALFVYSGLRLLKRPPSERFQFGYFKTETLAAMFVAIFLVVIGSWLLYGSYVSFVNPGPLNYPVAAMVVEFIFGTSFLALAMYKMRIANMLGSLARKTDARNTIKSGATSLMVFFGVAFSYVGFYQVEAIAGMIIAFFVFLIAYSAIRESSLILLDACECPGYRGGLKEIALSVEGVKEAHQVLLRRSGPYVLGEMHIRVDGNLTVATAHGIAEKIEKIAMEQIPHLKRLTIKVEAIEKRS